MKKLIFIPLLLSLGIINIFCDNTIRAGKIVHVGMVEENGKTYINIIFPSPAPTPDNNQFAYIKWDENDPIKMVMVWKKLNDIKENGKEIILASVTHIDLISYRTGNEWLINYWYYY